VRALALAALVAAGCNGYDDGFAVDLFVDADAATPLARVHELDFAITGGETSAPKVILDRALNASERVRYRPQKGTTGPLRFQLIARDGDGVEVAAGEVTVALKPAATVTAHLPLAGSGPADDGGVVDGAPDLPPVPVDLGGTCPAKSGCGGQFLCDAHNTCTRCTDGTDDSACNTAFAGTLCIDGACVKANCRNNDDCHGQVCGAQAPFFCGTCEWDRQCNLGSVCNGQPSGLCVANMCNGSCPSGRDRCCAGICTVGNCCAAADCATGETCSYNVCTTCAPRAADDNNYYVDAGSGDDQRGLGTAACPYHSIARALETLNATPSTTPNAVIHLVGSSHFGLGENFPLVIPTGVRVTGEDIGSATIDVPGAGYGFILRGQRPALQSLALQGALNAQNGVVVDRGTTDATLVNVTVTRFIGDGVLVRGQLHVYTGCVFSSNGTISQPAAGIHIVGAGTVDLVAASAANSILFDANGGQGILVEGTGALAVTGAPITSDGKGSIVVKASFGDGILVAQDHGAPLNKIDSIVILSNKGDGLHVLGGSALQLRRSLIGDNRGSGVRVSTHVLGPTHDEDVARIDLGLATDPGANTLQSAAGALPPNDGAGLCFDLDDVGARLVAAGDRFGAVDCAATTPGSLKRASSCSGAVDVAVTGPTNSINLNNCQ
jgi:hypothetical protein